MSSSITHPPLRAGVFELPAWKTILCATSAILLALLFFVSGTWKITDPFGAAVRMNQAKIPAVLSLAAAIGFGIVETFAAALLLVPRFRRWGAILTAFLLLAFMGYIGINYNALHGAECSCFPWLKRAVGPGFFIGDGVMLALAVMAGLWARPSEGMRGALLVLGAVAVFAGVSYGANVARQTGLQAPDSVKLVDGQTLDLQHGRVFLYFFDPECTHCQAAATTMSKYKWDPAVKQVMIPTRVPQFAGQFAEMTGYHPAVSNEIDKLRQTFKFDAGPYGVALENGRQKAPLAAFEGEEPKKTLQSLGLLATE